MRTRNRHARTLCLLMVCLTIPVSVVGSSGSANAHRQLRDDPRDNKKCPLDVQRVGMDHTDRKLAIAIQMFEPWTVKTFRNVGEDGASISMDFNTHSHANDTGHIPDRVGLVVHEDGRWRGWIGQFQGKSYGRIRAQKLSDRTIVLTFKRRLLGPKREKLWWRVAVGGGKKCHDSAPNSARTSKMYTHRL